jgi:YVTN family beta-propeller protein
VVDTIDVGQGAAFIAVTPDNARVYVINSGDSTVSVIDTVTDTIIDTIAIGAGPGVAGPGALVFSPDGTTAYLSYGARFQVNRTPIGVVLVIDTATNAITRTFNVGAFGWMVVSPDGSQLYVTNSDDNTMSIVDTSTNAVTATVAVDDLPSGLAVNPQGTNVYVANLNGGSVSVISVQTAPPDSWHIPDLVGELLGAVDRDGFGWVVIGNHFIPIPPRSPSMSAIARAAGPYMNRSIENRDIGEHIHKLRNGLPS